MKYMVIITKHHDGFSQFDSKVTDYKITTGPYGRDWGKWRFDDLFAMMYRLHPKLIVNNRAARFCGPQSPEAQHMNRGTVLAGLKDPPIEVYAPRCRDWPVFFEA
jgi:hypothetical protein